MNGSADYERPFTPLACAISPRRMAGNGSTGKIKSQCQTAGSLLKPRRVKLRFHAG